MSMVAYFSAFMRLNNEYSFVLEKLAAVPVPLPADKRNLNAYCVLFDWIDNRPPYWTYFHKRTPDWLDKR